MASQEMLRLLTPRAFLFLETNVLANTVKQINFFKDSKILKWVMTFKQLTT